MVFKMELLLVCFYVIQISMMVTPITVSSNGNSPEVKMIRGMMVDVQKGFVPMTSTPQPPTTSTTRSTNHHTNPKLLNSTKLSINERYRRLIPYMTFYYANDLTAPTTQRTYNTKNVEVEKVEIVEAAPVNPHIQRQPKKIVYSYRNIPKYHGNRLTQYNIASANPTKLYKESLPIQVPTKATINYSQLDHNFLANQDQRFLVPKPFYKPTSVPFAQTRKPYQNHYNTEEFENVRYYLTEKEPPKYKLIPYEQTPPVKYQPFHPQLDSFVSQKKPVAIPVIISKEPVYIKPRPTRPNTYNANIQFQQPTVRKQPTIVSESYYEKRPPTEFSPVVESGFKPLMSPPIPSYPAPLPTEPVHYENEKQHTVQVIETRPQSELEPYRPDYHRYIEEQPRYFPQEQNPSPHSTNPTLGDLLNSLQINKSIPKPITRENVSASIRTLIQVLNSLKADSQVNDIDTPVINKPKPFVTAVVEAEAKPVVTPVPIDEEPDFQQEQYLAPVNPPSQHIDDYPNDGGSTQRFPLQGNSDDEGGTPGKPGVDYPTLTTIPPTSFDCKTQRYKGFFADPETRCQVWHYCDLNGGQASFLCPNGTIFSQAGLTCDWWFNVRCASTTQLYVLNESLYKFILPHSPKFPEDYSGPLVDKYLTLKFKEMEEQFSKNKKGTKADSSEDDESPEETSEKESEISPVTEGITETSEIAAVSEASVVVGSPGTSGNVERLQQ